MRAILPATKDPLLTERFAYPSPLHSTISFRTNPNFLILAAAFFFRRRNDAHITRLLIHFTATPPNA